MYPYPRGSEWRKWDLHIHTPASYDWDRKCSITEKDLVDECIKNNLSVIAITDHHRVNWIDKIRNYAKGKNLTVLPGVELRTDKGNKGIHIIAIFDEHTDGKKIYDKLLCPLNLSEEDIKRKGDEQIYCDFEQACEIIHKLDGLVMLHAGTKSNSIEQLDSDIRAALKKDLAFLVDIFEVNNEKQIQNYRTIVFPKIKNEFPCIITSDAVARNLNKGGHSIEVIGKKFTWIKADPTFEGLKQIIYEPRERAKIQTDNPEPIKSIYSIDSINIKESVINKNLSIKETQIPLNQNLVAVIGGKGSGKTALLDLLANCYPQKINPLNRNSFVRRIFTDGKDLNTKITFLNTEDFSKKLDEEKFVIESDIEYIPQGQIDNKIGDTKEFHKFLQNLIFESNKIKKSVVLSEYNEIKQNIEDIKTKIEQLNQEIYITETKTQNKELENLDRGLKLKNTERENIKNKVATLKKGFTREKLEEIQKISKKLSDFQNTREKILNLRRLIQEIGEKFATLDDINKSLERINSLTRVLSLNLNKIELFDYLDIKDQLETIEKNANKKLLQVNRYIKLIQERIGKLQENKKVYTVLLNRLYSIDTEIKQLKEKQKLIEGFKKLLLQKEEDRQSLCKNLFQNYINLQGKYKEIIKVFSEDTHDILAGVDFKASLVFNFNEFAEKGEDILDLRTIRESKTQKVSLLESDYFKEIIDVLKRLVNLENKNQDKIIDDLIEKVKIKTPEFIQIKKSTRTNEDLYEWLFGDYLSLNTEVYFNNIPKEKLSLGQKCTVLLKVYLAQGDNSILVDQPDDNLDNEFIMSELVKAIRKAKANRQIIIASNNANVVINSDAEQIIVANYKDNEISYIAGSIENPVIRNKAIQILEGGREAFENREKKYGFKYI